MLNYIAYYLDTPNKDETELSLFWNKGLQLLFVQIVRFFHGVSSSTSLSALRPYWGWYF